MKPNRIAEIEALIEKVDRTGMAREVFVEGMAAEGVDEAELLRYAKEKDKRDRMIDNARRR